DGETAYGRENKHAVAIVKQATTPSAADEELYKEFADSIEPYQRKLSNIIEKTMAHKQNAPHKQLLFGRLSKNILPLVLEDNPHIFYKKSFESNEVDAVFTLLVDCSASMHHKMDET